MTIRVNTSSKGYNTDNEIVLYVHPDGYGYGQISVNGSSDDVDLKILPKGNGKVEVCNLHITGISGSIEDKINSIESVIATVDISGSSISALSLSDKVTDIENDITTIDVSINDILTKVDAISGKSSVYEGGIISNSISAYTAKNNKIAFSFKVKEDKIVGITPYEGLPKASDVLGMTAYVETDGKEYYATENGWLALQAEGVYKTVKLTDDFISHTHYASIGPEDASNILFGKIEYVDIESSEECVPVDHTHLIRWKKDGNGKIVARILFDNHINTPHLIQEDEIGFDIISTAVKNGLDENQVFQSCTLTENISGSPHTHTAHITVKQALELYKKQREFIVTNTIQSESNLGYYDVDAVDTNTGEHTYSQHIHYVTWKYEAGQNGIIRQEHLGQYSISENESDELHNYTQYDVFGHIKPCTASINVPVENNNEHTHDIVYNKSIFNEIFTALETTKFNKTGGIIHGRVGIKDGFTYIDADKPTSGAPYEMVIGTNSTVTISGALSGAPYWQHTDNDAIRIGSNYVNIYENRNLGVGDFSYSKPTSGAIHAYRNYDDTKVVIESKGSFTPSLELVSGTDEPTLSGSQIGGEVFVNNTGNNDYSSRPIGEVIFKNKLADRGFSFSQGDDVNLVLNNNGDLEVLGNLIVYGTSSVISSTETHFADNIIELNSISGNANMTGSALQVGFAFKRGQGKEDYFLLYNEQTESMVAGVSGVFNAMPFHEGSIIEGQGVVFGSGLAGDNVDTYRSDANNFRYSSDNGLYIDSTSDVALDINNNRIVNISQGINSTDAINLGQLNSAIGSIIQDHGQLPGLGDDDHLQYIRVDGTRPFSNVIKYDSTFDIISNTDIPHKSYVDGKFSSVASDLLTHTVNTNNPHNVTIEQLGGGTFSQRISIPSGVSSTHAINKGQFDSHSTNTNNPHNVTIEQLGGSTFSQRISIPSGVSSTHAINKGQFDNANNHSYRQVSEANATVGGGWITVAQCTSGRHHGEVIVTDADSSDHSFIRIDWLRSYVDSSFTVINCGGHANRITGVRVLYQTSDNTYGVKKLQVYVTTNSNYAVKIHKLGDIHGYSSFSAVTPIVQNSISGYALHGKEVNNLNTHSFAVEEGIRAGGAIRSDDHIRTPSLYINGSTNNSRLSSTDWGFRNQTDHGYIQFGPANTSHAHIYTDRANFYFNKQLSVNGATVWNSGNDGSGSGLDADKLDGVQGSQFLRSDTSDTFTGTLTIDGNPILASGHFFQRGAHHSGHLCGSYNNIGENSRKSNPIYTIGSNYNPSDAALGNMYGVGFTHTNSSFINFSGGSGWGMYVASDGDARVWLNGSTGTISSTGDHYVGSNKVWHQGNDGSSSGLDADKLDGQEGSYYLNYNNLNNKPAAFNGGSITNDLTIRRSSPSIYFEDTSSNEANFWVHINNNRFYILADRDSANGWETPHALQLESDTNKGYMFGGLVWTSNNDGSGSGLDADKLDGQDGSYYLNYNNLTNKPNTNTPSHQMVYKFSEDINGVGCTEPDTLAFIDQNKELRVIGDNHNGSLGTQHNWQKNYWLNLNIDTGYAPEKVFMNYHCTYVVDTSGRLTGFGHNSNGACGWASTLRSTEYEGVVFPWNTSIEKVIPGNHTLDAAYILAQNGNLYFTGNPYSRYLHDSTSSSVTSSSPVLTGIIDGVMMGYYGGIGHHSRPTALMVQNNGNVRCRGYNGYGQLGIGNSTDTSGSGWSYVKTSSSSNLTNVTKIKAAGGVYKNSVYALSGTNLFVWGYNGYGQLGVGDTTNRTYANFTIGSVDDFWVSPGERAVAFCRKTSTATFNSFNIYATGYNAHGALGLGDTTNRSTFTHVSSLPSSSSHHVVKIKMAGFNTTTSIALTNQGRVYGCGFNNHGQLADGSNVQRTTFKEIKLPHGLVVNDISVMSPLGSDGVIVLYSTNRGLYGSGYNSHYYFIKDDTNGQGICQVSRVSSL